MRSLLLLATAAASLAACQADTRPRDTGATPPQPEAVAARPAVPADRLIGPDGIGPARSGMTIGGLRAALPPGTRLGPAEPFMVDVQGLPVLRGTDTLLYVLVVAGEPAGDAAPLTLVATRNQAFRTAEGVGPGTPLTEAAATYGAATLAYNTSDESREYASFARFPHANVRFRPGAGGAESGLAGTYSTAGEHNETSEYDRSARIEMVLVDLRPPAAE